MYMNILINNCQKIIRLQCLFVQREYSWNFLGLFQASVKHFLLPYLQNKFRGWRNTGLSEILLVSSYVTMPGEGRSFLPLFYCLCPLFLLQVLFVKKIPLKIQLFFWLKNAPFKNQGKKLRFQSIHISNILVDKIFKGYSNHRGKVLVNPESFTSVCIFGCISNRGSEVALGNCPVQDLKWQARKVSQFLSLNPTYHVQRNQK